MNGHVTPRSAGAVAPSADALADVAAELLASEGAAGLVCFDAFPAPLFATDCDGRLLYFNDACLALTGRTPKIGVDRWCICSALKTLSGDRLPLDQRPIADALREGRALRNVDALVERPDGGQTAVRAFPTPAIGEGGRVVGAVNLFIPSDGRLYHELLATAQRCRTLAKWIGDRQANDALTQMAAECDEQALILTPRELETLRN